MRKPILSIKDLVGLFSQGQHSKLLSLTAKTKFSKADTLLVFQLRGASFLQLGKLDHAIKTYKDALVHFSSNYDLLNNLGEAYRRSGQLDLAFDCFKKGISVNDNLPDAFNNAGLVLRQQGAFEAAEQMFLQAQTVAPDFIKSYLALGNFYESQGKIVEAENQYNNALAINKNAVEAYNALGLMHLAQNNLDKARLYFERTVKIQPTFAIGFSNLGNVFRKAKDYKAALRSYDKAVSLSPNISEFHASRGLLLDKMKKGSSAVDAFDKAIFLKPSDPSPYLYKARIFHSSQQIPEALSCVNKALELNPLYVDAFIRRGLIHASRGSFDKAFSDYDRALEQESGNQTALYNIGTLKLRLGEFGCGWDYHDKREQVANNLNLLGLHEDMLWTGATEQRVLVMPEQGVGDEILFASTLPDLLAISKSVGVLCDRRLLDIFTRSFGGQVSFFASIEEIDVSDYDAVVSIGSLPKFFRRTLSDFEASANGFLKPDTHLAAEFKKQLMHGKKRLVGLSWKSRNEDFGDSKSLNLDRLLDLVDDGETKFVNLQYGDVSKERLLISERKCDFEFLDNVDNTNDLDALFSLVSVCDEIVTVSNVTAHIAGAIAVPTKVLVGDDLKWRWHDSINPSHWYESCWLYRTNAGETVNDLVARLSASL
jgi:tetratricopeptide (TPR) repeat protein